MQQFWKSKSILFARLATLCMIILLGMLSVSFAAPVKYNEAPMLAELVQQGLLPPVEERLPKNPMVIQPLEEVGQYGGTWWRAWTGLSDSPGPSKLVELRLVRFSSDGKDLIPELADQWSVSEDGKVFTFHLREGIKWSDGKPFTADDVIFWHDDIMLNTDLTPSYPRWLSPGGNPAKVVKVDAYTFKVIFESPYPLFSISQAYYGGFFAPKHYLKQFHPKYTSIEKLNAMAKEAGLENWYQLFGLKNNWLRNEELPVLFAWKVVGDATGSIMYMERNPYYFKVDTEGNQLPYIDRIAHRLVSNGEIINMQAISGEIDMQARHMTPRNLPVMVDNSEKGNYQVFYWRPGVGADPVIGLNQSVKDPVKRKLFQDLKFRQALSLAINREEMNELCYLGLGKPHQAAIPEGMPYYSPEWEKAFAEYDPERANQLLDEIGLTKRDQNGFRLGPDGKTLELTIEFPTAFPGATTAASLELIQAYWEAVGLKTVLKGQERSLYNTRCSSGDAEIGIWNLDRCAQILANPGRLLGTITDCPWAVQYALWYNSGGKSGEEPPPEIKRLYELWDQIVVTVDEQERDRLVRELVGLHAKNIWMIGTVGEIPQPVVVKNYFRNVPKDLIWDDLLRSPGNAFPEQFFIKQK